METTPQGKKPVCLPNFIGTAVAVIIAFLIGVVVGLHPSWIPLYPTGGSVTDMPSMNSTPGFDSRAQDRDHPTTPPATEATTEPSAP